MYLLLLFAIGRLHQHFGFLSALRPAQIVVIGAVAYAFVNRQAVNTSVFNEWPIRVILALFAWACLTAPFGLSLGGSGSFVLFTYSKVVLTALLLVAAVRDVGDLKGLVWAYVISCGILVVFAWTVFDISQAAGSQVRRLDNLYMYDANDIGLLFSIGIPLGLWLFRSSGTRGRILSLTIVLGMVATIARSGSRGGFLGLIAVGLALVLFVRELSLVDKSLLLGAAGVVLMMAAPPGYWAQMDTLTEPTEDYNWDSYYGRKETWERGVGYMVSNPLTGVGIDNFSRAEATISERAQLRAQTGTPAGLQWRSAHNSFVQVGVEMGLPGLILWSSLLVGGVVGLRRRNRGLSRLVRRGIDDPDLRFVYLGTVFLPVAFVGFGVTCFFLTFGYLEPVYILTAFTAATFHLVRRRITEAEAPGERGVRGRALAGPGEPITRSTGG
jgi:O-antigen ligase